MEDKDDQTVLKRSKVVRLLQVQEHIIYQLKLLMSQNTPCRINLTNIDMFNCLITDQYHLNWILEDRSKFQFCQFYYHNLPFLSRNLRYLQYLKVVLSHIFSVSCYFFSLILASFQKQEIH